MPPDSPRSARSKPAWRSWARTNSPMMRRAVAESMASSSGNSKAAPLVAGPRAWDPLIMGPRASRASLSVRHRRRSRLLPGPLSDDLVELPHDHLRALVAEQRGGDALAAHLGRVDLGEEEALVVHGSLHDGGARGRDDLRAAPERDRLVHADAVDEDDVARGELGVRAVQGPPRGRRPEPVGVHRRDVAAG